MDRFQGPILGCCGTTKRLHWADISVHAAYAAGRAFIEGFSSPNIDRHGNKPVVVGASGCRRPQCRAKRTTETGSREAQSVKSRSDSVLTLQYRCCDPVGGRVHPA